MVNTLENYATVPALQKRGWTEALIRQHLGAPDSSEPNPYYRSAAPTRLYAMARVLAMEASPEWAAIMTGSEKRRAGAAVAVETKRQRLLSAVDALEIAVPAHPFGELVRQACDAYNCRQEEIEMDRAEQGRDYDWTPASPESGESFLLRITVNYLRHRLTRYDRHLQATFGRVGVREAYQQINRKVYDAIAAAYPDLAQECARQMQAKESQAA